METNLNCRIIENTRLIDNGYLMTLESMEIAAKAQAGQFIHIKLSEDLPLLRRPISICDVDPKEGIVKIFYLVVGKGTELLSKKTSCQSLDVMGPLGKGFSVGEDVSNVAVVGGGCGVAPMLYAAKSLRGRNITAVLGFRDKTYLAEDFQNICSTIITTEDGSHGIKGRVDLPLEEILKNQRVDMVLSCGPVPMLRRVKELCEKYNVPGQVSVEERMACGVGACLVCACSTKSGYKRACKEGPVFDMGEVDLNA